MQKDKITFSSINNKYFSNGTSIQKYDKLLLQSGSSLSKSRLSFSYLQNPSNQPITSYSMAKRTPDLYACAWGQEDGSQNCYDGCCRTEDWGCDYFHIICSCRNCCRSCTYDSKASRQYCKSNETLRDGICYTNCKPGEKPSTTNNTCILPDKPQFSS